MMSVVANPRIGPVPKAYSTIPVIIVVKFESKIAEKALLYPSASDREMDLPARSSSLMRSKISTLASTAIPSVSTNPAIPERVSTEWKEASTPSVKKLFTTSAPSASRPGTQPYITII